MTLSSELLAILVCPKCKGDLACSPSQDTLTCEKCRVVYPVRDEIPVLLIDEAMPIAGGGS